MDGALHVQAYVVPVRVVVPKPLVVVGTVVGVVVGMVVGVVVGTVVGTCVVVRTVVLPTVVVDGAVVVC